MITIKNALSIDGSLITKRIQSEDDLTIDATGLTLLPGLIDPHVHFRTPGLEYKEDWMTAAKAAIAGGYTTVFDMPNTLPPTITQDLLIEKKAIIDAQLKETDIPLRYQLFFGADKNHLNEIKKVKNEVIGIKVFMGCSTGNLVIDDDESLDRVFRIAAEEDMLVAVHAEDEARLCERKQQFLQQPSLDYAIHSEIRDAEAASIAVAKAISLSKKYGTRLYILHVSTIDELQLIDQAKMQGLKVYAETTPHHLFLNDTAYAEQGGRIVVNPPIRTQVHQSALWDAVRSGVIDTIGSDHAPHTQDEKAKPYGACPSGMPGIETTLPLLLTAYHENLLTLNRILQLTSERAREIFKLSSNDDAVLVNLDSPVKVDEKHLQTKCKWSAFHGRVLYGWPVYTIINGKCFEVGRT